MYRKHTDTESQLHRKHHLADEAGNQNYETSSASNDENYQIVSSNRLPLSRSTKYIHRDPSVEVRLYRGIGNYLPSMRRQMMVSRDEANSYFPQNNLKQLTISKVKPAALIHSRSAQRTLNQGIECDF